MLFMATIGFSSGRLNCKIRGQVDVSIQIVCFLQILNLATFICQFIYTSKNHPLYKLIGCAVYYSVDQEVKTL